MEAKLIKVDNGWILMVDNIMYATDENAPYARLSLKNCQAIEFGYDLDELADKYENINYKGKSKSYNIGFKHGFQKALEILGDKKFEVNEVVELCKILMSNPFEKCGKTYQELTDSYIQSLQQTEWDVEIIMEDSIGIGDKYTPNTKPKLDADGCIILKRKI